MYPILIAFGPIIVPSWHFFYVLGAIAAFYFFRYINTKQPPILPDRIIRLLYLNAYVCGYFGARLLHILVEMQADNLDVIPAFTLLFQFGGMVFYGGLFGGAFGVAVYVLVARLDLAAIASKMLPSLLLGLAIGRIGCFLNGDDFGAPVPLSISYFGVNFANLGDDILRYPVQLYESILVFIPIMVIWCKLRKGSPLGRYFAIKLLNYYAVIRFFLEFLRGDPRGWWVHGQISTSQGISLFVLLLSFAAYCVVRRTRRSPSST